MAIEKTNFSNLTDRKNLKTIEETDLIKSRKITVKAGESPTVVLNRAGATAPSQQQPTVSPDPFRDVIKTEPAPDLPSLIEDMIRGITTTRSTTSTAAATSKTPAQGLAGNQLPNFDFMEQVPLIRPPFDYGGGRLDPPFISKIKHDAVNDGDASSRDTVSLTHDTEPRIVNRKPTNGEAEVLGYGGAILGRFNHTDDEDSRNALRRGNTTVLWPKENVSLSEEHDGDPKVDNRVAQHDNHSEPNGSSTAAVDEDESVGEDVEQGIFSFDSVLELLFSSNASGISSEEPVETTKTPDVSSVSGAREGQEALAVSSSSAEGLTEETETVETSSKLLDNEIPMSVGSLLKLAGCNIYGRMYRVGRIITELSNPCLECRCTEIGVQCKPLEC